MVLTIQEFYELCDSEACKALHDRSKPLVAEPGQNVYLGYVPVTWDEDLGWGSVEDADDWKEVDIVTEGDREAALAALRAVFGSSAEIDG